MRRSFQLAGVGAAMMLGALLPVLLLGVAAQESDLAETRTVALDEGWNLVSWTGDATEPAVAIADLGTVDALFTYDRAGQQFRSFTKDVPAFLNSLASVATGQGLWVFAEAATEWAQPVVSDAQTVALVAGLNMVSWLGPSGTSIPDAVAPLGDAVDIVFVYDAVAQAYGSYAAGRPGFLNTDQTLRYGDGLWLDMRQAALWAQPATTPPVTIAGEDGVASLTIPRGAAPVDATADEIQIVDVTDQPDGITLEEEGGALLAAYSLEPAGLTFTAPVYLAVPIDPRPGAALLVVHFGDALGEVVETLFIDPDTGEGRPLLRLPLEHFSRVTIVDGNIQAPGEKALTTEVRQVERGNSTVAGQYLVGEDFVVEATTQVTDYLVIQTVRVGPAGAPLLETFYRAVPHGSWSAQATFRATGPVVPTLAKQPRFGTSDFRTAQIAWVQTFTCTGVGDFTITVSVDASIEQEVETKQWRDGELVRDDKTIDFGHAWDQVSTSGECVLTVQVGFFQLLEPATFGQAADIFGSSGTHVIVSTEGRGVDARELLPITLRVTDKATGLVLLEAVISPPADENCRGPTGCSRDIEPVMALPGTVVVLEAFDKDGNPIAQQEFEAP